MPINQQVDKENVVCMCVCVYIFYMYTYTYTMEYYSVVKRNELMAFAAPWMGLETIVLREATQEWKTKHHMFSFINGS